MSITKTSPGVNKHHLLYPENAFKHDKNALILREFFVVDVPVYLHSQLHQELDIKHGICIVQFQIGPEFLPDKSTLEEIFNAFKDEKTGKLDGNRTVLDYLSWLNRHIPYDSDHKDCWWLADLVRDELDFFERHVEEMRQM